MVKPVIGLSFSGGGYRAATFDLGVLSFLNAVRLEDGSTLLDCVHALSSVSGGTIPAMKYMLARAEGKPVDGMIKEVFDFLCNENLVDLALKRVREGKSDPETSLIRIMAGIYDEKLFGHKDLGVIKDNLGNIPVKDYTALATDFKSSLPFRFRLCAGTLSNVSGKARVSYGIFGNNEHRISRDDVHLITPGEALACSSCFPSGFEPMMFPDDFKFSKDETLAEKYRPAFGIMDGGISDNQGIESILKAEEHLRKRREDQDRTDKALDLVIVNDVASPYMKREYKPCKVGLKSPAGKLDLERLLKYGLVAGAITLLLFIFALLMGWSFLAGVLAVILVIFVGFDIAGLVAKKVTLGVLAKTFIGHSADNLIGELKFSTVGNMMMNRAKSIFMMSSEVFLKRLRQMSYNTLYDDKEWNNRVITNTVYSLREGEKWESLSRNNTLPEYLDPSDEMKENSATAAGMGTTLWFTKKDVEKGIPEALFAAGQYSICYKLLKYIYEIKLVKSKGLKVPQSNLTAAHDTIIGLEPTLREFWDKFKEDCKCMLP